MEMRTDRPWVSRIRRFVARPGVERCELCSAVLAPEHSHLLELPGHRFRCACDICVSALTPSNRFLAVEPRKELLRDFALTDAEWDEMQIPIDIVFFVVSANTGEPIAIYPGPAGPMESNLPLVAWTRLIERNPVLATLRPDVEALLVNRGGGVREYYRVSIDCCYALVGLMRERWHGFSGGTEVWDAVHAFFQSLKTGPDVPTGGLLHG